MFRRNGAREAGEVPLPRVRDQCLAPGCRAQGAIRCSYVDKRDRRCTTSWCGRHWTVARGVPYCRRHASTVEAVAGGDFVEGLPDVDNRAPSLVGWVSRDLDAAIRSALTRIAPSGAVLVIDPVRLVLSGGRRWQRNWKLVDHAGILSRVTVEVDERDDSDVLARVDKEVIGRGVPPWIERRRRRDPATPDLDEQERRAFTQAMARSIELVVSREEMVPKY